jgi:hypothetical protein
MAASEPLNLAPVSARVVSKGEAWLAHIEHASEDPYPEGLRES